MKPKILIVLINKKIKNLGGQDRRWLRLISSNLLHNNIDCTVIVNDYTVKLSLSSDAPLIGGFIKIEDRANKLFDYIHKCITLVKTGSKYERIYISNQSMYLLPAVVALRYLLRKKILFSYNGTSLLVHKNKTSIFSYFQKIKLMLHMSDKIEILNPRLIEENCFPLNKVTVAPCTFSDTRKFTAKEKKKIIIFSGHLIELKGIYFLKKILCHPSANFYTFKIFGDSDCDHQESVDFKKWLIEYCNSKKNIVFEHRDNMEDVYGDAAVFLSLQKYSNYPSQSVVEALYSGCSVLLTDTGDSKLFGNYDYLSYVEQSTPIEEIYNEIERLYCTSNKNRNIIEVRSKQQHSINRYAKFMISFLND